MENLNIRFYNPKTDIIPNKKDGISLVKYIQDNNGGECKIGGTIGINGSKSHVFKAFYITVNRERIIVSYFTVCGTETYKTVNIGILPINSNITCKKCQKHHK